MNPDHMKKLADIIRNDKTTQQKLKNAKNNDEFFGIYVELAQKNHLNSITRETVRARFDNMKKAGKLSEAELTNIAGAGSNHATCTTAFICCG